MKDKIIHVHPERNVALRKAKKTAWRMLKHDMFSFLASDAHHSN